MYNVLEQIGKSLHALSTIGWYLDPTMSLSIDGPLEQDLYYEPHKVELVLEEHFRNQIRNIERRLLNAYPSRAPLLQDAFWAHYKRKFSLSIPVFLAQADGIWADLFKVSLFMRNERQKIFDQYSSKSKYMYLSSLLSPISNPIPLWMSQVERAESFENLNRHQVMHGESLNYGTETNSLKTISLLGYICCVEEEFKSVLA